MRGAFPGEQPPDHDPIGHLEVVANADAYLIAPASANTIAKLAAGLADSMVTTAFLACTAPRAVAPAMNDRMYADAATQANLATLRERGVRVIEPDTGALASRGEYGIGRLPSPDRLLAEIEAMVPSATRASRSHRALRTLAWDGLRVLVTAGGTREPIDPVRFIGNRSSGRMGLALAGAAARRGAEVTLVAANVSLPPPAGVRTIEVETTAELAAAVAAELPAADVLLMAAAPADFRAASPEAAKISREAGSEMRLRLEPTEDILAAAAGKRRAGQTLVGFAAETGGSLERARRKLERKSVDAIVFNDVSRPEIGFDSTSNEVTIVEHSGEHQVPQASKEGVAEAILDRVEAMRLEIATEA
jgi:phosphopantothenoylcysteine decarboxylase / phosphopantothenate---cysteine ligase